MGRGAGAASWGTPRWAAGSGRVRVSGADFLRGRSLETERNSGASVQRGVEGALAGPVRAQEERGVSLMEMDGGNIPIFSLVASWMAVDARMLMWLQGRSEERRVGKECLRLCRSRWSPYH